MINGNTTTTGKSIIRPQASDVLDADELAQFRRLSDKVSTAQEAWGINKRHVDPDSVRLPIGELSESALAEGFYRQWAGDLAFDRATGEWLEWDFHGWEVTYCVELHIKSHVERHIPKMKTPEKQQDINNRWLNLRTYRAVAEYAKNVLGDDFDSDSRFVGLPYRLKLVTETGEIWPSNPCDNIRKRLPNAVDWRSYPDLEDYDGKDPWEVSRLWTTTIDEMLGSYSPIDRIKIANFLKQWFGSALLGDTRNEIAIFLHGPRGSGKSTIAETMAKVFGGYFAGIAGARLKANSNDHLQWVAKLDGALLATVGELPDRAQWPAHLLNQLISGEFVTANQMRQNDKTFESRIHLLVTGNHRPKADANDGIWRRLGLIKCNHLPDKVNKHLKDQLLAELPGIFNWALEGAATYLRNGRNLDIPAIVLADTDEYRAETDPMERWYTECLTSIEVDTFTPTDALHANLTDWWQRNISGDTGRTPGKTRMGNFLTGRGYSSGTKWVLGSTQRVRFGVGLCQQEAGPGTET